MFSAIQSSATPKRAKPPATTALLPIRTASLVPRIDATAIEMATGSSRRPVPKGV